MSTRQRSTRTESGRPAERELRDRLRFETYLANLASRFQRLPAAELSAAITEGLQGLVETLGVDRSTIMEFSEDGARHRMTHGYAREGIQAPEFEMEMASVLPWYTAQLKSGRRVVLDQLPEDLPEEAQAERMYVAKVGMKSHVGLPLDVDREIVGCLAIGAFRRAVAFAPEFMARLDLLASIFAGALYRRRAETRLREAQDVSRTILAATPSAIALLDRDGRVASVNEAWRLAAAGSDCPGLRATTCEGFASCPSGSAEDADPSTFVAGIRAVLSGESVHHETILRCSCGGRAAAFHVNVTPLNESGGGAVVTRTDITELEQAKAALEASLQQVSGLKERLEAENVILKQEIRGQATSRRSWAAARR